jgi:hypothetical protein
LPDEAKFACVVACQHEGCDATRLVRTSDLFQVRLCEAHTKAQRAERRKATRKAKKEAQAS